MWLVIEDQQIACQNWYKDHWHIKLYNGIIQRIGERTKKICGWRKVHLIFRECVCPQRTFQLATAKQIIYLSKPMSTKEKLAVTLSYLVQVRLLKVLCFNSDCTRVSYHILQTLLLKLFVLASKCMKKPIVRKNEIT